MVEFYCQGSALQAFDGFLNPGLKPWAAMMVAAPPLLERRSEPHAPPGKGFWNSSPSPASNAGVRAHNLQDPTDDVDRYQSSKSVKNPFSPAGAGLAHTIAEGKVSG